MSDRTRPRVVVSEPIDRAGIERLGQEADVVEINARAGEALTSALSEADGLIVRVARIGPAEMAAAPRLKVIGKHGIGVDNIDVDAATERGIPVVFTPGSNEEAVAEHALTLMLMLARKVEPLIAFARAGRFEDGRRAHPGIDLRGKTLGLIGIGRIGGRLARMCRAALDMTVIGYDLYVTAERAAALGVDALPDVDAVVRRADVVSIHTPLTAETRNVVDSRRLGMMKSSAFLINCARGGLVDEAALVEALRRGTIAGAGIDVFEREPPPMDHPLLGLPNAVVTPHIAGSSVEALRETAVMVAEETLRVLRGEPPRSCVNPSAWRG